MKCWTLVFGLKLNNFQIMLIFSRTEPLLTLHALSVTYWVNCSKFMDWKIWSNEVTNKIPTQPHLICSSEDREQSVVPCFWLTYCSLNKKSTATKTVSQELFSNVSINLENQMHVFIRKPGLPYETPMTWVETALFEHQCNTKYHAKIFGHEIY